MQLFSIQMSGHLILLELYSVLFMVFYDIL